MLLREVLAKGEFDLDFPGSDTRQAGPDGPHHLLPCEAIPHRAGEIRIPRFWSHAGILPQPERPDSP